MKLKKVLSMIVATAIFSTALVGCNNSGGKDTGKNTLTVWSKLTEKEVAEVNKVAAKWGKENNINVKVIEDKGDTQAFLQAANSPKGPDVVFGVPHDNLGTFEKAGVLSEAPEGLLKSDEYTSEALIDAVTIKGKKYGMPIAQETTALLYNKDMVSEVPSTMEELVKVSKDKGFVFNLPHIYFSYGFISANGGYIFKNNNGTVDSKDIGLSNEGAIKGYKYIQELVTKEKIVPSDITEDISSTKFLAKESAFYLTGPWEVDKAKQAGINLGVAQIPTLDGKTVKPIMGVQAAFVSSKSKNQDLAWKLTEYLSKNTGNALLNTGNRIPVLKSITESEEFAKNDHMLQFVNQAKVAESMPNIPEIQAMWTPAIENLGLLIRGEITPEKCGKLIVDQIKEGISQQK